ncbi:unnamed protein product [Rotaria sp. Silwood1]|nr:unnamed protein product [Rotaria sp. Silwood1]
MENQESNDQDEALSDHEDDVDITMIDEEFLQNDAEISSTSKKITDLVFKAAADLPRFGHGAFLTCLETLYKGISGNDLKYTAFVGKPFEISYQYAETIANQIALANGQPKIEKVYFIGDNPDVDIVGANMYNHLLQQAMNLRTSISGYSLLSDSSFLSATSCESILVCTGVYEPNKQKLDGKNPWKVPTTIKLDVFEAVKYIILKEAWQWIVNC